MLWAGPGQRFPTMVAAISNDEGELLAVHRTFLERRGDNVVKAAIEDPKRTLGVYAGHSIKLWRGHSGKPWLHMPTHETVVVAEGLEDGLTALVSAEIGFPRRHGGVAPRAVPASQFRTIVAVSGSNIGSLVLPAQVAQIVILAQRDRAGSAAERTLQRAIDRLQGQGIEVLLLPPPAWSGIKDLNDVARALAS